MKARRITTGILLGALAIAIPVAVQAAGWRGHGGWGGGPRQAGMLLRLADKLGLSADQRAQVQLAVDQAGQALAPLQVQLKTNRQAFQAAHDPGVFDEAAVRDLFKKQSAIREEMVVIRARAHAQALAALTQAQRDQLKQMRSKWVSKHAEVEGPDEE